MARPMWTDDNEEHVIGSLDKSMTFLQATSTVNTNNQNNEIHIIPVKKFKLATEGFFFILLSNF